MINQLVCEEKKHPDFIQKDPRKFTLADWGCAYRKFVARQMFL